MYNDYGLLIFPISYIHVLLLPGKSYTFSRYCKAVAHTLCLTFKLFKKRTLHILQWSLCNIDFD